MNRENRRRTGKKYGDSICKRFLDDLRRADSAIRDGDSVALNVRRIMGRKDYPRMQDAYRKFVEESRGMIFKARSHRTHPDGFSPVFELEGVEDWIFWQGDLIHMEKCQGEDE